MTDNLYKLAASWMDSVVLLAPEKIEGIKPILNYDLMNYPLSTKQPLAIVLSKGGEGCIERASIIPHDGKAIRSGSVDESKELNYILISGVFKKGDSGSPVAALTTGGPFLLGSLYGVDGYGNGIVYLVEQAADAVIFRESNDSLKFFKESGAMEGNVSDVTPLGTGYYAYGAANTTPHIHCNAREFHIKIWLGSGEPKRFDLVNNSKEKTDNIKFVVNFLRDKNEQTAKPIEEAIDKELKAYIGISLKDVLGPEDEEKETFDSMKSMWNSIANKNPEFAKEATRLLKERKEKMISKQSNTSKHKSKKH
jgi:hypothetical protein